MLRRNLQPTLNGRRSIENTRRSHVAGRTDWRSCTVNSQKKTSILSSYYPMHLIRSRSATIRSAELHMYMLE